MLDFVFLSPEAAQVHLEDAGPALDVWCRDVDLPGETEIDSGLPCGGLGNESLTRASRTRQAPLAWVSSLAPGLCTGLGSSGS